jgi:hypothetical protein
MPVAVHAASRAPGRLGQAPDATYFASLMVNAAFSSNVVTYSLSQVDENLEWNIWPHLTHHISVFPGVQAAPRRDVWSMIPTNR